MLVVVVIVASLSPRLRWAALAGMSKPAGRSRHRSVHDIRREQPEAPMRYMILVQSNPHFQERFDALPEAEREAFGRNHQAMDRELAESGELVVSEALADSATAKRVTSVDRRLVATTDGPFAEAKEHLAGFYLVDCENEARALEIAARVPDAVWGLVEVRAVLDTSEWDM
jgi:hypothetical protein